MAQNPDGKMTSLPVPPETDLGPMMGVPAGGSRSTEFGRGIFGLGKLYVEMRWLTGTRPSLAGAAYVPGVTPPLGVRD